MSSRACVYEGGLQVRGSKLAGTGSDDQWAQITVLNHDTLFIRCWSNEVLFSDNSLDATHARMSMLLGEDSIYHPDIKIKYLDDLKMFRATRQTEGVGQQPFVDTYHAVEIEVEAVEWELNGPSVEFRRLTSDRPEPAAFRSLDCFETDVYDQMMGIDPIHPLAELARYMARRGVKSFYSEEYADFLGLQEEQARMLLIGLTNAGYVNLDFATRYCEVKPRAERHIKARKGVIDYDVLAFYSNPQHSSTNAILSLNNLRLEMKGIGRFGVSEAQDVKIIPDGGELALGENRSFEFNGVIQAGKFELSGAALPLTTTPSSWTFVGPSRCASRRKWTANTMRTASLCCVGWQAPLKKSPAHWKLTIPTTNLDGKATATRSIPS